MKREILAGLFFAFFFVAVSFAVPITQIRYEATDIGSGRWQYTYEVTNLSLTPAIETEATLVEQPKGVELEYRIIAINKAGEGSPSNTVMVVL